MFLQFNLHSVDFRLVSRPNSTSNARRTVHSLDELRLNEPIELLKCNICLEKSCSDND